MAQTISLPTRSDFDTNLIINSDMNLFQRGATFTGLTAGNTGQYVADRFQFAASGITGSVNTSQLSVFNASGLPPNIQNALRFTVNATQSSLSASHFMAIRTKVEGYDIMPLVVAATGGFTCSFYVQSSVTGTYYVRFSNSGFDQNYTTSFTIAAANTWQRVVLYIPSLPFTSGTWNFTTGQGLDIFIWLAAGTNYQGVTQNAWSSGANQTTASQSNLLANAGATLDLTGFMLYPGQRTIDFRTRGQGPMQELALAQRYYEIVNASGTLPNNASNYTGGTNYGYNCPLKVTKRVASPNAIIISGFSANNNWAQGTVSANATTFYVNHNASTNTGYNNSGGTGAVDAEL